MKKVGNSPLLIEDGLYCGRKTLNMWLVSYTVIATARIKQKALFNFRLNGDVHLSWCKENVIDYVDRVLLGSKDVKIRPPKWWDKRAFIQKNGKEVENIERNTQKRYGLLRLAKLLRNIFPKETGKDTYPIQLTFNLKDAEIYGFRFE